ncbi:hypothetical protein MTR67_007554 [Solanum verrucosum]|uniref:Reverse transcriptase zinc-binding domain-containing protein n=1 Tax=Solanum verrucosum TaxID=315347 RepID=A0AAF0TD75_SOLVR|nr:hypothetical protein MTR67_007554 [Solanum verrucosum]
MKATESIWEAPPHSSWYWRKINSLKERMKSWHVQGKYGLTPTGEYSITCSNLDLIVDQPRLATVEIKWTAVAQPKHRVIMWLAAQNRLLTKDMLLMLNIPEEENECCLCAHQVPENPKHLFVECNWINAVRTGMLGWTRVTLVTAMEAVQKGNTCSCVGNDLTYMGG